jgi:hypothetical protein
MTIVFVVAEWSRRRGHVQAISTLHGSGPRRLRNEVQNRTAALTGAIAGTRPRFQIESMRHEFVDWGVRQWRLNGKLEWKTSTTG